MAEEVVTQQVVREILGRHDKKRSGLLSVLEDIQDEFGYLPEDALRTVAKETGWPLVEVYGVATFYRSFSLKPRGNHFICACLGTACHVRGAPAVVEELERRLGIKAGNTTPDNEFTLETANCLGACALGPMVIVDGRYFSKVRKSSVRQLIDDAVKGVAKTGTEQDEEAFPLEVRCPCCRHSLMDETFRLDGRPSILVTMSTDNIHGWLRLSSLYGSPHTAAEHDIPEGTLTHSFCPHCNGELADSRLCPVCKAPMAPLAVRGGGMWCVCSRRGCQGHVLDLGSSTAHGWTAKTSREDAAKVKATR